jgi:hypothetical protein
VACRLPAAGHAHPVGVTGSGRTAVLMPISVKMLFSALEEIRTPNLLIRSNHAYCDVLNEICAVQPTGRANRTRNSQMLSVRRPRDLYGATYGARSITAWLIAGSQRSRSSSRSTTTPPNHGGPVTSSHRCLVVGGHRKLPVAASRTSAERPRSVVASRDITRASWAQIDADYALTATNRVLLVMRPRIPNMGSIPP